MPIETFGGDGGRLAGRSEQPIADMAKAIPKAVQRFKIDLCARRQFTRKLFLRTPILLKF